MVDSLALALALDNLACLDGTVRLANNSGDTVEYIAESKEKTLSSGILTVCKYIDNREETCSKVDRRGRVEVCRNNTFGTVCDDRFDVLEAKVVCGQLGFNGECVYSFNALYRVVCMYCLYSCTD